MLIIFIIALSSLLMFALNVCDRKCFHCSVVKDDHALHKSSSKLYFKGPKILSKLKNIEIFRRRGECYFAVAKMFACRIVIPLQIQSPQCIL